MARMGVEKSHGRLVSRPLLKPTSTSLIAQYQGQSNKAGLEVASSKHIFLHKTAEEEVNGQEG